MSLIVATLTPDDAAWSLKCLNCLDLPISLMATVIILKAGKLGMDISWSLELKVSTWTCYVLDYLMHSVFQTGLN